MPVVHATPFSRFFSVLALLCCFSVAGAQQGPPNEVRQAIDGLMALFESHGDQSLREYAATRLDPDWVAEVGESSVFNLLGELRKMARGINDDVTVGRTAGGNILTLSSAGRSISIEFALADGRIRELGLHVAGEATAPMAARDGAVQAHVRALERSGDKDLDWLIADFEKERFSDTFLAETTREERRALLKRIQSVAATAGGAMLDENSEGIRLTLRGPESIAVLFKTESRAPFRIEMLRTEDADAGENLPLLTWQNVGEHFDTLADDGFAGVVHLERDGKTILHQPYGKSNRSLDYDARIDSIYGIGSTPIDFTVAGLFLLAQEDKLSLDDRITKYFSEVPDDKESMTLRHLISGQSGLPDFHDVEGDWDPDLAWIDRQTAIDRILAGTLLFPPGEGRAHSHSAYGLAAAVIEIVSGKAYFNFLQDAFFQPAGMQRTGMNGSHAGLELEDFAEGYGNSAVGLPNIPPNWGPTSWLVMGSGGMYSTLGDMLRFYDYVATSGVLRPEYAVRYQQETVGIGGSDRGFYFFHAQKQLGTQALMMINGEGRAPEIRRLSRALEKLVMAE